jgi:hypothetical protein
MAHDRAMGPGGELARRFFLEAVKPVIDEHLPNIGYLAGRLGSGSDVLGYDDPTSADHDFGCRLTVLVDDPAAPLLRELDRRLEADLPVAFGGRPVRFPTTWDARVHHKIDLPTVHDFAVSRLGVDASRPLTAAEWLCLTGQSVLEVIGGPIFHDTTAAYRPLAARLAWYPDDVWHYVLAAGWQRLSQELPFVGRAGDRGDHLGSAVSALRLTRDVLHLAFLLERRWPPYPKWLGTALPQLPVGAALGASLGEIDGASSWRGHQAALGDAIDVVAARQVTLGLPCPVPVVAPFFDRPFITTNETIPTALLEEVGDQRLRTMPLIGSIEQWSDNIDLLSNPVLRAAATTMYEALTR